MVLNLFWQPRVFTQMAVPFTSNSQTQFEKRKNVQLLLEPWLSTQGYYEANCKDIVSNAGY